MKFRDFSMILSGNSMNEFNKIEFLQIKYVSEQQGGTYPDVNRRYLINIYPDLNTSIYPVVLI